MAKNKALEPDGVLIEIFTLFWNIIILILILHLSIQLNNKGHHEKKSNLNNVLILLLGLWPKQLWFYIPEHFFVHFTILAPSWHFFYHRTHTWDSASMLWDLGLGTPCEPAFILCIALTLLLGYKKLHFGIRILANPNWDYHHFALKNWNL